MKSAQPISHPLSVYSFHLHVNSINNCVVFCRIWGYVIIVKTLFCSYFHLK